jgi:predicted enzyme related to lactoylglutathione lyase
MSEIAGKVVWFELPAKDTKRAREFHGQLFGWQFQAFEGTTDTT